MKSFLTRIIVASIVFTSIINISSAQDLTMYGMNRLHQSIFQNPAYQTQCKVSLGLPAVFSSRYFEITNTGFTYNDVFKKGTGLQKDSIFIDLDNLEKSLDKVNYIKSEINNSLFSLGFWVTDFYVTLDITNKIQFRLGYPKEFVSIRNAMGSDNTIDFSGLGINSNAYNEFSFGLSKKIMPGVVVGGKIKRLWGIYDISTTKSEISVQTSEDLSTMNVHGDIQINAAPLPITIYRNAKNKIDSLSSTYTDKDWQATDVINTFVKNKNRGWAFDLGITYKLSKRLELSASIVDFGWIKWKTDPVQLRGYGDFSYNGLDIAPSLRDNSLDIGQELIDSITNSFDAIDTRNSYKTYLNTKIFFGANYLLTQNINVGVLSRTLFYDKKPHQSLTFSLNMNAGRGFMLMGTYSMVNRSFANLGLGMAVKIGWFQMYAITDNFGGLIWPKNTKSILSLRFGTNLLFGCKKKFDYGIID